MALKFQGGSAKEDETVFKSHVQNLKLAVSEVRGEARLVAQTAPKRVAANVKRLNELVSEIATLVDGLNA